MSTEFFLSCYIVMLFLQTVHIFEEIGMKAYELVGSTTVFCRPVSLSCPPPVLPRSHPRPAFEGMVESALFGESKEQSQIAYLGIRHLEVACSDLRPGSG